MKRAIPLTFMLTALMLNSCHVNWFTESYDVPWWMIAVPVVLILVISHILIVTHTYHCPDCGECFRPKWYEITVWFHSPRGRVMKCPKCGYSGFCKGEKPR